MVRRLRFWRGVNANAICRPGSYVCLPFGNPQVSIHNSAKHCAIHRSAMVNDLDWRLMVVASIEERLMLREKGSGAVVIHTTATRTLSITWQLPNRLADACSNHVWLRRRHILQHRLSFHILLL